MLDLIRRRSLSTVLLASFALAACPADDHSHDTDAGDGHHHDDAGHGHDTCGLQENCKDTVTLADGLEIESEKGKFKLEVVSFEPLAVTDNSLVVKITDADGNALADAEIEQDVFSVDCMHGGPMAPQSLTADADGNYEAKPYHLHGGPWDTTFEITAGGITDTAKLHLCVPDEVGHAHQD